MASWVERFGSPTTKRRRLRRLRRNNATEDGKTCPKCGDLWPWSYSFCCSCGRKLS